MLSRLTDPIRATAGGGWFGYGLGLAGVALVTASIVLLRRWTGLANDYPLYLIVVLATAALYGRGPAVVAALVAFLSSELLFVGDVTALAPTEAARWLRLLPFLLTALVTGQLAAALRQRADDARRREREAVALYEVVRLVPGSALELQPLLGLILDRLRTFVDYSAASVYSAHGEADFRLLEYRGPLPSEHLLGQPAPARLADVIQEAAARRAPAIVDDWGEATPLMDQLAAQSVPILLEAVGHGRSALWLPFLVQGAVTGALGLVHPTPGYYGEQPALIGMAFAQQAGAAIENARLYAEARGKAALEERQHLARELHDSVSQALYGIVLSASIAQAVRESDPARLQEALGDVVGLAEAGLAEMRALIFELRPESLQQEGLVAALEKQAAAVQARRGITVRASLADEPDAPLAVKEALYRIAQEALHNTVKHARARSVDLTLESGSGELVLHVSDDGRGFDPDGEFPGHLGLRSMHERAAAVGGALHIDSGPGQGTRLRAHVPLPAPT